jgi:hypothetical protein
MFKILKYSNFKIFRIIRKKKNEKRKRNKKPEENSKTRKNEKKKKKTTQKNPSAVLTGWPSVVPTRTKHRISEIGALLVLGYCI